MKKVIFIGHLFAVVFLLFACNPSSKSASDTNNDTAAVATDNNAAAKEAPTAGQATGKSTPIPTGNVVPPKHATKDELVAFIIDKVNASTTPLTATQEESIQAISGRYNIPTFSDMVIYRKVKKSIIQAMQKEVLTEGQLKVFPKKNK